MTGVVRTVARRLRRDLSRGLAGAMVLLVVLAVGVAAATSAITAPLDGDDPYVLLVIGADQGPPRDLDVLAGNADAQHLLVVSPDRQHVSILTFPRDTWVDMVGLGRRAKINADLKDGGGIEPQVRTIENLVGVEVDDWIVTGFNAFDAAIDELGGVEVEVDRRLYDPRGSGSDLQPGVQRLSGWAALTYSRDRASRPNGDLGRVRAHANVLVSLHRQLAAENASAADLARYLSILRRHTVTSVSSTRMIQLAGLALEIDPANVHQVTAPAFIGSVGVQSVVLLSNSAEAVFADLREDGILESYDSDPFSK